MSVWILPNSVADIITSVTADSDAGFDKHDLISGPRSTMWRQGTPAANHEVSYVGANYPSGADNLFATHAIVARFDLVLANYYTSNSFTLKRKPGSAAETNVIVTAPTVNDLTGPYAQDYVVTFSRVGATRFTLSLGHSASCKGQFSKLYIADGLDMGDPMLTGRPIRWDSAENIVLPLDGTIPYAVEKRFILMWNGITKSKVEAFLGLPQIMNWPFFVYDDGAAAIPWKLEHCLLESYDIETQGPNLYALRVSLLRLRHYDI